MGNDGVKLQIGHGSDKKDVIAFIRIVHFNGDNAGSDKLSSCSSSSKGCQCRICTCTNLQGGWFNTSMTNMLVEFPLRINEEQRYLCSESGRILKEQYLNSLTKVQIAKIVNAVDQRIMINANKLNIIPGDNVWYELQKTHPFLVPSLGFLAMNGPDFMHTANGGIVKCCLEWQISICYLLRDMNKDEYGNIVSNLDVLLKNFDRHHSDTPSHFRHLQKGISDMCSASRHKKCISKDKGTGITVSGHIPLEHLEGILYQTTLSLQYLLPEQIKLPPSESEEEFLKDFNIRTIMYNAGYSVLDVVGIIRHKADDGYSDDDLEQLHTAICNANAHLTYVHWLRGEMIDVYKKVPKNERVDAPWRARKPHLMLHFPMFLKLLGNAQVNNTQVGEHFHIRVKEAYELVQKNKDSTYFQMAQKLSLNRRIEMFNILIQAGKNEKKKLRSLSVPHNNDCNGGGSSSVRKTSSNSSNQFEKEEICYNHMQRSDGALRLKENKKSQSDYSKYIHPFLSWEVLTDKLQIFMDGDPKKTTWYENFKSQPLSCSSSFRMYASSQFSCMGTAGFNNSKSSWQIYCNNELRQNRDVIDENVVYKQAFSTLEASYESTRDATVGRRLCNVRVMAILQLQQDDVTIFDLFVVAKMEPVPFGNGQISNLHDPFYRYSRSRHTKSVWLLDIDLIDLQSFQRPSCTVRVFSPRSFPTPCNWKECQKDYITSGVQSCMTWLFQKLHLPLQMSKTSRWLYLRGLEKLEHDHIQNVTLANVKCNDITLRQSDGRITQVSGTIRKELKSMIGFKVLKVGEQTVHDYNSTMTVFKQHKNPINVTFGEPLHYKFRLSVEDRTKMMEILNKKKEQYIASKGGKTDKSRTIRNKNKRQKTTNVNNVEEEYASNEDVYKEVKRRRWENLGITYNNNNDGKQADEESDVDDNDSYNSSHEEHSNDDEEG